MSQINHKYIYLFFWGSQPASSSGCFEKATQTPNAGHPIWHFSGAVLKRVRLKKNRTEPPNNGQGMAFANKTE
jgi:hypothetical protein